MRLQDQAPISRRAKLLAPKRRGSALGQVSNPGVLNGSCGQVLPLTLMPSCARNALTYKTGEETELALVPFCFPRSKMGEETLPGRGHESIGCRHNLGTFLEHPPQWQVHKKLESHTRRQRPVMR